MRFERGQVYVFSYLWKHQAYAGEESGRKPRPCAVIPLIDRDQLLVLAISSSPDGKAARINLPELEARRLGLSRHSAVVASEVNVINDDNLTDFASLTPLGKLSDPFTKALARAIALKWQAGELHQVQRS